LKAATVVNPKSADLQLFILHHQRANTPKSIDAVMADLASIKVGTPMLDVWACGKGMGDAEGAPTAGGVEVACGEPFFLGQMTTTTECTTSNYGDTSFFIRHQLIEEDWQHDPALMNQFGTPEAACGWSGTLNKNGAPKACASNSTHE